MRPFTPKPAVPSALALGPALALLAGLVLAPPARAQSTAAAPPDLGTAVDRYIQPLLDLDVFSGVVLVARGDSVLLARGYGQADREFGIPIEADHAFRIASISKSFTRVLVGRLAERGTLGVDDPIARWLPDFPSGDRITIRRLLDHRAGVPSVNSLPFDEEARAPNTLGLLVDSIARLPLDFEPGAETRYSNGGYAVLALVLEKAAGSPYERLLATEVLEPLGLSRTDHEEDGEIVPRLARGYEPSPVAFGRFRRAPFQQMVTKTGGGSLTSTAADLHRWTYALGRDPILETDTWADLFPREDFVLTGRCPGYNSALARSGEWIAVVLANNYAAGAAMDVASALVELARGEEPEPLPVTSPTALGPAERAAVVGAFEIRPGSPALPPGAVVTVEARGDDLVASAFGTPVDVLVPQGDRSFLLRALWSRVTFDPPVDGRSPGLEVQPLFGREAYRAERVGGEGATRGTGAPVPGADVRLDVRLDVYAAALAFYSPPRNQVRWIDPTPLGSTDPDAAPDRASLGPDLRRALVERLGERFLPWSEGATGEGGRLRVSGVEPAGTGRYRLTVEYMHRTRHFEGPASAQAFLVACGEDACRILERGPAPAPGDW